MDGDELDEDLTYDGRNDEGCCATLKFPENLGVSEPSATIRSTRRYAHPAKATMPWIIKKSQRKRLCYGKRRNLAKVPLETQDTHREVRDCADEDDYASTRERSVLLQWVGF
ncbi:hypothetical protein U9M48_013318 [Paspalum notatum var. saurae]|uniref:Uncharacterized protein n=1 Tax=Paspalum notatum var. saurae TaxID=547442 RepID=A0AAQ3SZ83_PASNO